MQLTTEENLALLVRRRSFQLALADPRVQGALIAATPGRMPKLAACPCCGYPTLEGRANFDICPICSWEDDGQDDANADEVCGGPNSDYSLTEARRNFIDERMQYRRTDPKHRGEIEAAAERDRLIAAYDALLPDVTPWSFIGALPELNALYGALFQRKYGKYGSGTRNAAETAPTRRADRDWEIWTKIAYGTLRPIHPFKPPSLQSQDTTKFAMFASRVDALVRERAGESRPVVVHRGVMYRCWGDASERAVWLTRYEGPATLELRFVPYDGTAADRSFPIREEAIPEIARLIAEHFARDGVPSD